jgi:hypothetical protein
LQVVGKSFLQPSLTHVNFPIIKSTQSIDLGIHNKGEVVIMEPTTILTCNYQQKVFSSYE